MGTEEEVVETRAEKEERLRREAEEQESDEQQALIYMRDSMLKRYGPLVELLQGASTYLGNLLVDAKRARNLRDLHAVEYYIRRDISEALGVAIAMAMGVEMRRAQSEPAPVKNQSIKPSILGKDGSPLS